MKSNSHDILMQNRIFLWIAFAAGLILLIPLLAMQFTNEVAWGLLDFVIAGGLLFATGSIFVWIARKVRVNNRLLIGIVVVVTFLWLWAELAVGIFTNWGS